MLIIAYLQWFGLKSISLGQSEKEDVNGSKWTVTTFHTTPHMPTYLAAFAICDYEHVSRTERGKEVSDGDPPGKGTFVLAAGCSGTPASGAMPTDTTVPSWFSLWSPPSPVTTLSAELQNGMQRFPLRFCGRVSMERLLIKPTRGRFWAPPLPGLSLPFRVQERTGKAGTLAPGSSGLPVVGFAYMLLQPWSQGAAQNV